ncbi:GNAT family N-acetyltransferase [Rhodovulum sp. DZ06]|uniref:GNAT family N-acetyltransferase n=1 Tax=Rhodovulum sp. DZ06 TaxID=3425126 RepID=UPI003D35740A
MPLRITRHDGAFNDWAALRALLAAAFAFMEGRINPPSSLHAMSAADFAAKAEAEILLLAHDGPALLGCLYARPEEDALYLGKIAVAPGAQSRGIGRALVEAAAEEARARALPALRLQTRIELTENHAAFAAMGFVKTAETAHAGYARPTSITMTRRL